MSNSTEPSRRACAGVKRHWNMIAPQTVAEDETPVAEKDHVTFDLRGGEVALFDRPVLVDETVIGRLITLLAFAPLSFDDPHDLLDRVLGSPRNALLRSRLSPIASINL